MPYYVQKSGKTYRIGHEGEGKSARNVSKKSAEALELGFRPEMTYEDARLLAKRLQAEDWVKAQSKRASKAAAINERLKVEKKIRDAFLTDADAEDFESNWLAKKKITRSQWRSLQKVIVHIGLHPSKWFKEEEEVYGALRKHRCSASYALKLLRYLNIWGYYLCEKQGKAWMNVPSFSGTWTNRFEANRNPKTATSATPLSFEYLEEKRSELKPEEYRALYTMIAFALRPRELRNLAKKDLSLWRLSPDPRCGHSLSVFQQKLYERGVPKADCWKRVPTLEVEQQRATQYIIEGGMRIPYREKMMKVFGRGYAGYSPRNYSSGWWKGLGYELEARRRWMGHQSVTTTEDYDRKTEKQEAYIPGKRRA